MNNIIQLDDCTYQGVVKFQMYGQTSFHIQDFLKEIENKIINHLAWKEYDIEENHIVYLTVNVGFKALSPAKIIPEEVK